MFRVPTTTLTRMIVFAERDGPLVWRSELMLSLQVQRTWIWSREGVWNPWSVFQDGKFRISSVGTAKDARSWVEAAWRLAHVLQAAPKPVVTDIFLSGTKHSVAYFGRRSQGGRHTKLISKEYFCAKPSQGIQFQTYRQKNLTTSCVKMI